MCVVRERIMVARPTDAYGRRSEVHFNSVWDEFLKCKIELKSLILAQIERWRHALHMQVER